VVKRRTLRCQLCGAEHPVDKLIVDLRREEAVRFYRCQRCAEELDEQEEEASA
jgi:predicted SprT family Zn-dependent metalloprotease